ncbi:MAG: carbon starvation CstA family protein, partial [Candidatus Omnitrophica bacterium]|nr:carbon starvation CstA family protein [Candidatus Omnitrophota bacterium]
NTDPAGIPDAYFRETKREAYFNLGLLYGKKRELNKSIESFKNALEIDLGYSRAKYYLASSLIMAGEIAQARAYYEELRIAGVSGDPLNPAAGDYLKSVFDKMPERTISVNYTPLFSGGKAITVTIKGIFGADQGSIKDTLAAIEKVARINNVALSENIQADFIRTKNEGTILIEKWVLDNGKTKNEFWVSYNTNPPADFPNKMMITVSDREDYSGVIRMLTIIFLLACGLFVLAYLKYGRFLNKHFEIHDKNLVPSHHMYDGIDYVPAPMPVLFGHHFSSIAGAGPVLGPIIAGVAFGWGPAWVWVIIGSIFIGGAHDFSSLVISIRNRGRSIAEIANTYMSKRAYRLMLLFIWLSLIYVLTVFTDLTANTFKLDGGVATSSLSFIFLAIGFGVCLYHLKMPLKWASLIFVSLLFSFVWLGQKFPLNNIPAIFGDQAKTWDIVLIVYCFIASVTPVWILLQPRDYLSSFLLYASVIGGFIGIVLGGLPLNYPVFTAWSAKEIGPLFPMLFVTVACGAISGFHAIVASGTTSKQIKKESDALPIGYGAMLVEGLVAVIALATVMVIGKNDPLAAKAPLAIYGAGMAKFLSVFGVPEKFGASFGLLALSTFILTTLDTATRLARYILQEFFNMEGKRTRYLATAVTLFLPTILVLINIKDASGNVIPAWKSIWPVFGATNQLLAGLALLVVAVWLRKKGKHIWFVAVPMVFMLVMTLWALFMVIAQYKFSLLGIIGSVLFFLAVLLIAEAMEIFEVKKYVRRISRRGVR